MIKLPRKKDDNCDMYRIECKRCRRLVARGEKFPIESPGEGIERIRQYKEVIAQRMKPLIPTHMRDENGKRHGFKGYSEVYEE